MISHCSLLYPPAQTLFGIDIPPPLPLAYSYSVYRIYTPLLAHHSHRHLFYTINLHTVSFW